jgi:hypothetical protein
VAVKVAGGDRVQELPFRFLQPTVITHAPEEGLRRTLTRAGHVQIVAIGPDGCTVTPMPSRSEDADRRRPGPR